MKHCPDRKPHQVRSQRACARFLPLSPSQQERSRNHREGRHEPSRKRAVCAARPARRAGRRCAPALRATRRGARGGHGGRCRGRVRAVEANSVVLVRGGGRRGVLADRIVKTRGLTEAKMGAKRGPNAEIRCTSVLTPQEERQETYTASASAELELTLNPSRVCPVVSLTLMTPPPPWPHRFAS